MAVTDTPKQAIIDTSVLLSLYHLNLLSFLNLIYTKVRVPREVEREFLQLTDSEFERSYRYKYLENFYNDNSTWFIRCNEYDSGNVEIYRTNNKLDRGESEVFVQNESTGSISELLLDENAARNVAESKLIQHHGVLFILTTLEISFQCCIYQESVVLLRKKNVWFTDSIIESVYIKVKRDILNR